MDFKALLKRLTQAASNDIVPANKALTRAEQEAIIAAKSGQHRNPIGDLDTSSTPLPDDILKANQPTSRELAEMASSSASRELPKNLPALVDQPPNLEGVKIPSAMEERLSKLQKLGLIGGAGLGSTALINDMGGGSVPPQAAVAPKVPDVAPPSSQNLPVEQESPEETALKQQISTASRPNLAEQAPPSGIAPTAIDFGSGESIASVKKLEELQNRMREAQRMNEFGRIGTTMIAGMSGQPNIYKDVFDERAKNIANEPELYKQQVQMEKEDPNSPQSEGFRSLAAAMGFPVTGTASAADLEKQFPQLANIYNQREAQKARAEQAKENRLARKDELGMRLAEMKTRQNEAKTLKSELENHKFIERASTKLSKGTEAYNKVKKASAMIDEAVMNPSGISDMTALYSLISALDPASTVREGEVGLAKSASGLIGRAQIALSQLTTNPKLINTKSLNDIRTTIKQLEGLNDQEYNAMKQHHLLQAKSRGIPESRFNEIDPYYNPAQYSVQKVDPLNKKKSQQNAPAQPAASAPQPSPQAAPQVGRSGLTPEQRRKRIEELKAQQGAQ